jgi:hypothetical protein
MATKAGRFWPSNLTVRQVAVTGVDQRAQGIIGLLERIWSRGMAGQTGTYIGGNSSSPSYKWAGPVDYVALANVVPTGASRNLVGDPATALPGTSGPLIVSATSPAGNPVTNSLAATPVRVR